MHRTAKYFRALIFSLCMLLLAGNGLLASPVRDITQQQWQQLTSDKAFSYRNDIENAIPESKYSANFLQRAISYFFRLFSGARGTVLIWLIVFFVLVTLSYLVLSNKNYFFFQRRNKTVAAGPAKEASEDDIVNTNWDSLLQEAVRSQDVRLAVRYSYMKLLQLLQSKGLISYQNGKTNFDYYSELAATNYKQPFKQLSRQYEYAWYGQYPLSAEAYHDYMSLFDNVKKQLGA